jgi:ATP-dependent exoDNAse (exonuclease V) alpha subunit
MPTTVTFEGLPEGIIPISPSLVAFNVEGEGGKVKLERRQLALVPGYAFTDYKAQGQTMECVIVDIANPPSGKLSPFNVYVALSRSRGRKTIRILRRFDPALFMHHPSEDLRIEMEKLRHLDRTTKATHVEGARISTT